MPRSEPRAFHVRFWLCLIARLLSSCRASAVPAGPGAVAGSDASLSAHITDCVNRVIQQPADLLRRKPFASFTALISSAMNAVVWLIGPYAQPTRLPFASFRKRRNQKRYSSPSLFPSYAPSAQYATDAVGPSRAPRRPPRWRLLPLDPANWSFSHAPCRGWFTHPLSMAYSLHETHASLSWFGGNLPAFMRL